MKMRPKRLMTATALTPAALLVLSSATQVAGAVVCTGMDGHIDIEPISEGCCIPSAATSRGDAVEPSIADSGWGHGTAVVLTCSWTRSRTRSRT
jgi:hypothetical protein